MKVLVVESSTHTKVLENVYYLLKDKCSSTFYLNKFRKRNDDLLFPSAEQSQIIRNRFHSATFFIWLLFYGRKYDYINISTGPEGSHFSGIINILFFYICCLVYRKKIILTIKNIRPYLRSTPGLFSFLRSKSIKYLRRFTFETETQRDYFYKNADIDSHLLGVSYDRYADLLDPKFYNTSDRYPRDSVRIGLLGTINRERRDYNIIIDVLKQISAKDRSSLTFVTLGECHGGNNNEVIKKLTEYVKVECKNGILSPHEFDMRGTSCDLLISLLTNEKEYGKFNGTGSFGDAVYLRKKVILPSYVDEDREFDDISIYYRNSDELLAIFKNLKELSAAKLNPKFFERFTTENVFKKLIKDLRLCVE